MTAYRPAFVKQLDGSLYEGLNCTTAAGAMALDRHTLGAKTSTGSIIRKATGDTKDGTTQRQVADAILNKYGQKLDVNTPFPIATTWRYLDEGKGLMLAGQESATRGTRWQGSETFGGNHQWWDNERRRNSQVSGGWEHLIFDPLADGRRPGIAHSPFWVPEGIVHQFTTRLNVSSSPETHYVALGPNSVYVVFTKDTEPHLWATDVPPDIRHVDQEGYKVAQAIRKTGHAFGSLINMSDLSDALKRAHHDYGTTIDPSDVQWLLDWARKH